MKKFILLCLTIFCSQYIFSQEPTPQDTLRNLTPAHKSRPESMTYTINSEISYVYERPRPFELFRRVPRNFANCGKELFKKKSILPMTGILASTLLLVAVDEPLMDGAQQFGRYAGIDAEREFKEVITVNYFGKSDDLLEMPTNLNTWFYWIGEGWPSLAITGSMYVGGRIRKDYRMIHTGKQLMISYISMGITIQLLKRTFGRESPFVSSATAGRWRPFTNFKKYQDKTPHYDAFPSGHLATVMATITILSDNYPEYKRIIYPVGFTLMALNAYSMMNNGVHWASDYPLAIGVGYLMGKVTSAPYHKVVKNNLQTRNRRGESMLVPVYYGQSVFGFSWRYNF